MADWSRRALLTAGTAAGALGVSGLVTESASAAEPPRSLVLHGFNMQLLGDQDTFGAGDRLTVRGQLQLAVGGSAIGEIFISGAVLTGAHQDAANIHSYEQHLFRIGNDTITGSGVVRGDGVGTFTVTGSSGRYAAVRGTYTSQQSANHHGDGIATFSFLLAS